MVKVTLGIKSKTEEVNYSYVSTEAVKDTETGIKTLQASGQTKLEVGPYKAGDYVIKWTTSVNGYSTGVEQILGTVDDDIKSYSGPSTDNFVTHTFLFYDKSNTDFSLPAKNTASVTYSPGSGVSIDSGSQYQNPYFPILIQYFDNENYAYDNVIQRPGTKLIQVYPVNIPTLMQIGFIKARPRDVPPYNGVPQ